MTEEKSTTKILEGLNALLDKTSDEAGRNRIQARINALRERQTIEEIEARKLLETAVGELVAGGETGSEKPANGHDRKGHPLVNETVGHNGTNAFGETVVTGSLDTDGLGVNSIPSGRRDGVEHLSEEQKGLWADQTLSMRNAIVRGDRNRTGVRVQAVPFEKLVGDDWAKPPSGDKGKGDGSPRAR